MALFTFGYEKRELGDFVGVLVENKIEILADIRINPLSRKKGFSKNQLAAELTEAGIEYVHFRELGTPQQIRDRLHTDWDYARFFRDYEAYVKTQKDTLERLAKLAAKKRVCIMCFEREPNQCHRKVVAEYLHRQFKIDARHL